MKGISLLCLSLLLTSCGAFVITDYEEETDFSPYTTYNFFPSIESGLPELDDLIIVRITDSLLQGRGFQKSDTPAFLINYYAEERPNEDQSSVGLGINRGQRNTGVGVSVGIPLGGYKIDQQLTLDFIDNKKDILIWQAVIKGSFSEEPTPKQIINYYFKNLQKALNKFPPE